jgi:hypothetical protein
MAEGGGTPKTSFPCPPWPDKDDGSNDKLFVSVIADIDAQYTYRTATLREDGSTGVPGKSIDSDGNLRLKDAKFQKPVDVYLTIDGTTLPGLLFFNNPYDSIWAISHPYKEGPNPPDPDRSAYPPNFGKVCVSGDRTVLYFTLSNERGGRYTYIARMQDTDGNPVRVDPQIINH